MVARKGFDQTVAARTRGAQQILSTPELLAAYIALGGLAADLQAIVAAGREAEISNHAQGSARSDGKAATAEVLRSFDALQRDYSLVMAVVRAVRAAVARANPDDPLLTRLDDIIANTAAVTVEINEQPDGKKTRTRSKALSQEAIRAEIQRDAEALLALAAVQAALAERRVDRPRLERLRDGAGGLSGKLGDRAAKKGASKDATERERVAAASQRDLWGGVYGILAALGRQDARVSVLLKDARG